MTPVKHYLVHRPTDRYRYLERRVEYRPRGAEHGEVRPKYVLQRLWTGDGKDEWRDVVEE